MIASARNLCAILIFVAMPLIVRAQGQNAPAAPPAPTSSAAPSPAPATSLAPDPCTSELEPDLRLTAANGVPLPMDKDFSYTFKNNGRDKEVLVRLKDINPYTFKCTVSINTTRVAETGVSTFLGLIGGVTGNLGANTPNPASAPTTGLAAVQSGGPTLKAARAEDCVTQYRPKRQQVESLQVFRDRINQALRETQKKQDEKLFEFAQQVAALRSQSACSKVVQQATSVAMMPKFDFAQVSVPGPAAANPAQKGTDTELPQAIDELATRAQTLVATLTDNLKTDAQDNDCKKQLQTTLDQDSAFLGALINSTTAVPSAVTTWTNQLNAFNTVRSNMGAAQTSIVSVLGNQANFVLDASIHGDQDVVTYTATCTPVEAQTIAVPGAAGSSAPAPAAGPTPAPAAGNTWTHDFKFGIGPRFVLAGGLVVSPLQQIRFSTTATPGGSGDTANTIIQQENSSTRLLPMAMLHTRYWDFLPADKFRVFYWLPNYLSVGVTAKSSDNQGTNIEYLFGPSWAFAGRQLFITAGGYAGQQQRLAGSTLLTVGSTTALGTANLPITQTTIWKAGFAITWAPGGK